MVLQTEKKVIRKKKHIYIHTCQGGKKEKHKIELSAAKNAHGEMCNLLKKKKNGEKNQTFLIKCRPANLTQEN